MKKQIFMSFSIFLLFISPLLSQEKKLIVIVERANIYIKANINSTIVETVERETILTLRSSKKIKKIWNYVYFLSKKSGITKAGYILDSSVERLSKKTEIPLIKRVKEEPEEKIKEVEYKPSKQIKVISKEANLRSENSFSSQIIQKFQLGFILQAVAKMKKWYRVNLPPDKDGFVVSGYIHQSFVLEIAEKVAEIPEIKKKKPTATLVSRPRTYTPIRPKSSIGAIVGYSMTSEENYGSGLEFGGNISYGITENIAVELVGIRFQSTAQGDPEVLSDGKLSILPIQLSIQARLPLADKFVPYILCGGSYYLNKFALNEEVINTWNDLGFDIEEKIKNAIGFHFGAGIDYFITKNVALNTDLKYCLAKTKGTWTLTDQISETGISGDLENINLNSFMFGVGLKYYF